MESSKSSRWLKWFIILAMTAGGYWGWKKYRPSGAKTAAIEWKTNVIARGEIVQSVTANGALTPVRNVEVGSQVSGIIKELRVDFNAKVTEGDILAKIDPATYERALARVDAELLNSKAAHELADFTYKRAKQLFDSKLISETEYTQALVGLHQAEANVKIREAAVESAKVDLDRTTIVAPISGIIISRSIEAGQTVAASFNTPRLFVIANDLAKMQIEAAVSEADIGNVQEGQTVNFRVDAFPGRQFKGKVRQVRFAPNTNQNVVTYTTIVAVDNADLKLRPGMTADATVVTAERKGVLRIPVGAFRVRPPEGITVIKPTNSPPGDVSGSNAVQIATTGPFAGIPIAPWRAENRQPSEDERKKWMESLTPEQREKYDQARARMRQMAQEGGGGGGGGGGMGGGGMGGGGMGGGGMGGGRPATVEGPMTRTIYLYEEGNAAEGKKEIVLRQRTIRTGITDGANYAEVLEGLSEGDIVVVSAFNPSATITPAPAAGGSPFGGGPFGGGGMRR